MNNLKFVETDVFNEIATCDFWGNINNEYLVTREQIGRALGYKNPSEAIKKITNANVLLYCVFCSCPIRRKSALLPSTMTIPLQLKISLPSSNIVSIAR